MEAAKQRRRRAGWPERGQAALIAVLIALASVAWIVTHQRMGGMRSFPGMELGSLGFYASLWVVMMAAMMFPSVAPAVAGYERLRGGRPAAPAEATALFVAGYLSVWTAVGLVAYAVLEVGRSLAGDELAWDGAGRWVTAGAILAAAAYQVTPWKRACLTHCRSPMGFLSERWGDGRAAALRLGAAHGAWCAGCCWALMAALFAVGVMNLGWMAVIAASIAAEKLLPWPVAARRSVAIALLLLGLAVALAPDSVPGLSMPAGDGMDAMTGGR